MLDNGFSLARVELLNWGNFHGYQKFSLFDPDDSGPLFAPPPASAILGINGSGKSTLIDALMIVLLPFEGSVKLGVTNDVESGGSGGRTIKDYVLGKHSSHSGVAADPESIYGRKEGCSFVILNFVHNRHPQRSLTIGRAWWFQNHKVSDTQVAFLAYDKLGLQDLCQDGKTPTTAKAFRQHVKAAIPNLQLFETMQSYFTAASQALGRISRDDLKILNRAFFVKSISNIDQFIRENMLIEQESPNLERLMENVRNGQEIAFSIETCEAKLAAIARILRELNKLQDLTGSARLVDRRIRLLSLHQEWNELRKNLQQRDELTRETASIEARLPLVRRDTEDAQERAKVAQARLMSDDNETRLTSIDQEVKMIDEKIAWQGKILDRWSERAKAVSVKIPTDARAWMDFAATLDAKIEDNTVAMERLNSDLNMLREKRIMLDGNCRDLRDELQHIAKNSTLIPRDLHAIKETAIRALKMPANHLLFVGELIQVKREYREFRTAIESVLTPIARNLLCHPDELHSFTRWLDAEGLRADVTAKRISEEELAPSQANSTDETSIRPESILQMIELRPANDHPFTAYLWRWLRSTFDYQVVDLKRFRSSDGKLVTVEGLVKKDQRTMRKLKKNFPFSLGWENSDMIESLTANLVRLNAEISDLRSTIETKEIGAAAAKDRGVLFRDIKEDYSTVASMETDRLRAKDLQRERARILESNPDYQALRLEVAQLEKTALGLAKGYISLETELKSKSDLLVKITGLLPGRERDLKESKLYRDLGTEVGGEGALEEALLELDATLLAKGKTRLQLEGELKDEAAKIDLARNRAFAQTVGHLHTYRGQFNDPNLPYEMGVDVSVDAFVREWTAAQSRLNDTELPGAQEKWRRFFDQVLLDSVKDTINEIKSRIFETGETIRSINDVLKLTNFEDLATDKRYLSIDAQTSSDERIRKFRKSMAEVEKTLGPTMRAQVGTQSQSIMSVLVPFVDEFQKDPAYRAFATDVRNHFLFGVQSIRRGSDGEADTVVEIFSGARKDAKSSAQTTQLAYALLASCLAFRFRFHDPVGGADTPRLIVLDEFGGKFDNEKPREIVKLLDKMGFQSVLVSPMSKADLLADSISHLVLVHKVSAARSKVQSYKLTSRDDYERLLASAQGPAATTPDNPAPMEASG